MKVFVVGASGYIGASLLSGASEQLISYGTSSTGANGLLQLKLESPQDFDYELIEPADAVFVVAAISAPDICTREYDRAWLVNVTGTEAFISKVIGRGGRVIFFSSDTVYGEREDAIDESARCDPARGYAEMKHEVEKRFSGNPLFKTIRLSYVFSREDKFTKYLISCVERHEEAEVFHPFYRAIVHRDDVVQGALAIANRWDGIPQSVINFGGPDILSRAEFAEAIRDVALFDLRFRIITPDAAFFANRPRCIHMKSQLFTSILGRSARHLREAASVELKNVGEG